MRAAIKERINPCYIKLSFHYRNHLDEVKGYAFEFSSIPDFKNYLRWESEKAMLIEYGKVDQERIRNSRTSNVRISIFGEDSNNSTFQTASQFAEFIRNKPNLARQLQLNR